MPVNVDAAEWFILANGRLLERHRLAALRHGAPAAPVLDLLRAYRNPDGGFGHALEPDVRGPESEPASTLAALEALIALGSFDEPMIAGAAAWIATIAEPDGGVPFVLPAAASYPRAPWMAPGQGCSHLTFAIAAALWEAGSREPWLQRATQWCWSKIESPDGLDGYWLKFGLDFLDCVPEEPRAKAAIERLRPKIGPDGSVPVAGGMESERLRALTLSERPGGRSRALFTSDHIEAELDLLERGQQDDGGWTFDWLGWSPGQTVEWRGIMTLRALTTLSAHGRT